MSGALALEVKNITKRFPGVLANDRVNFDLRKGEIHTLLGENGAGKSTLMNVIYGLYSPDEGEFFLDGELALIRNPHDAIAAGVGMVHQHFMLVPVFSVVENIILGSEVTKGIALDIRTARKEIRKLSPNRINSVTRSASLSPDKGCQGETASLSAEDRSGNLSVISLSLDINLPLHGIGVDISLCINESESPRGIGGSSLDPDLHPPNSTISASHNLSSDLQMM